MLKTLLFLLNVNIFRIFISVVLWGLLASFVITPTTNIDSLIQVAQKSQKSIDWNNVAEYYNYNVDSLHLRESVEQAYELAIRENNDLEIGRSLSLNANYFDYIGKPAQALEYFIKAKTYFEKATNAELHLADAIGYIGYYYNETGQYDQAIAELKKSIPLYRQAGNSEDQIARALLNIGFSYLRKTMPDSVIFYNQQALEWAEIAHDTLIMIESSNQLGILYMRKGDYSNALRNYEESLRLNQLTNDIQKTSFVLGNIAVLYLNRGNKSEALSFAKQSLEKARECNNNNTLAKILSIVGSVYFKTGNYIEAIEFSKASLEILQDSPYYEYTNYITLAESYLHCGEYDSCELYLSEAEKFHQLGLYVNESGFHFTKGLLFIARNNYKDGIVYLERGIEYRTEIEKRKVDKDIYNKLSSAYENVYKDYQRALEYKILAYNTNDSISKNEYMLALSDFQTKYATAEKELEITRLNLNQEQMKSEKARILIWLIIIAVLLLSMLLYAMILRQKKRTEKILFNKRLEEKNSEYDALVSEIENKQIKYYLDGLEAERSRLAGELHDNVANSLLAAKMKAEDTDSPRNEIASLLGDLQSQVRNISHELMPPVFRYASLFEIIDDYVIMQNNANGTKFTLNVTPEDGWDDLSDELSLELHRIIQEACGNALKHAKAQNIGIALNKTGNSIELQISNDGTGFDTQTKTKGVGLRIIKDRTAKLNGRFELISEQGKGTMVKVVI